MEILKKGKPPKYPKQRRLKCGGCGSKLKAEFKDCVKWRTVWNEPAYIVFCPVCKKSLFYCDRSSYDD